MKIDIKTIATYATIFITIGITWGMFSERLDAVEKKSRYYCWNKKWYCSYKRKDYVDGKVSYH